MNGKVQALSLSRNQSRPSFMHHPESGSFALLSILKSYINQWNRGVFNWGHRLSLEFDRVWCWMNLLLFLSLFLRKQSSASALVGLVLNVTNVTIHCCTLRLFLVSAGICWILITSGRLCWYLEIFICAWLWLGCVNKVQNVYHKVNLGIVLG